MKWICLQYVTIHVLVTLDCVDTIPNVGANGDVTSEAIFIKIGQSAQNSLGVHQEGLKSQDITGERGPQ